MNDDLSSEFDYDNEAVDKKKRRLDLAVKVHESKPSVADKDACKQEWNKQDRVQKYLAVDAYSRHKLLINEYILYHPGATKKLVRDTTRDRTDLDVIRQNSKFLWNDVDEPSSWEAKLAKRYYDKLFKEYCISDLSRYKENKIALRWRVEQEVVDGKGQFICGEKKCREKSNLSSWEVNFAYVEDGIKKNALVKLRLCPNCSYKLNYHQKKRKIVKPSKKSSSKKIKSEPTSDVETSNNPKIQPVKVETETETETMSDEKQAELWEKPVEIEDEKNRDDEFEEFLEDLFV